MAKKAISILERKNKSGITYYCRMWYPPIQNSRNITLGKKTELFTELEAIKKFNYLKECFKNGKYDYQYLLKKYDEKDNPQNDLTLNEIAYKYFDDKEKAIKTNFILEYKDRFNITEKTKIDENSVLKRQLKSYRGYKNYYVNYLEADEYRNIKNKKQILKYSQLGQTKIREITKSDLEKWLLKINTNIKISQKTKYNITSQIKTIFNYAVKESYLEYNHFNNIKKEKFTKNPHNFRERLLDIDEMNLLMNELYLLDNKNSFNACLLGLTLGARANSVLNIKKSDFKMDSKEFNDAYFEVDIINFKSKNKYTLPLVEPIGRYFYYLLKDYDSEEYIVRAVNKSKRTNKPFSELPKLIKKTMDSVVNGTIEMRELYKEIGFHKEKIKLFRKHKFEDRVERLKKELVLLEKELADQKDKYKSDSVNYLKVNFSFHNFRHQLVSLTSIFNPLYAKRILNHSSDNKNAVTERYIKSDVEKIKDIMEKALLPYCEFITKINDEISRGYTFEEEKEKFLRQNENELLESMVNIKVVNDIDENYYDNELFKILNDANLSEEEKKKRKDKLDCDFNEKFFQNERELDYDDIPSEIF